MPPRSHAYESDLPIDFTEPLSILAGDIHTYHLPLPHGFVLKIELDADGPLALRLLDSETWDLAPTSEARWAAAAHHAVDRTTTFRIHFVPPSPGDYMLLLRNGGSITTEASLTISADTNVSSRDPPALTDIPPPRLRTRSISH
jgi:hypothetical protein